MKTGFNLLEEDRFDPVQLDFLQKTVSIMSILTKEAMRTSERFCTACGRNTIAGKDMYYALMYEAHEFFNKNIEDDFLNQLEKERTHTYETDEESDMSDEEDNGEEEGNGEEEENEEYTTQLVREEDREFHSKVLNYANEWETWFPDDPVHMLLKNAIDKTRQAQIC